MDYKKIMVLSELNNLSEIIMEYAVHMAEKMEMQEVILLNTILPAHYQSYHAGGQTIDAQGQLANSMNMVILKKHREMTQNQALKYSTDKVRVIPHVEFIHSTSNINTYMEKFGTDMILCGSNDKVNFMEILFGSKTEKMVRKIDYPMIILTNEPPSYEIKNIALAVDVEKDNLEGIDQIIDMSKKLHAHLQMVYINHNKKNLKANEALEKMQELGKNKNLDNYSINIINNPDLEEGLSSFIRKYNPDMLGVLSSGKGKLNKLIYGSHTEEIISETDIPVIVGRTD
ncbi:MAG: universal stress protein [Bacteroidota bacterium]